MLKFENTTESGSPEDGVTTATNTALMTTFYLEASYIILANLLTIITFTINRHLRKRSIYCVINLAVADMLLGIQESVSFSLRLQLHRENKFMLWVFVFRTVMGAGSTLSLALVAVERMCATVWPVRHRNARPWAYTLTISMTWTAAVMSGLGTAIVIMSAVADKATEAYKILNTLTGIIIFVVVAVICVSYIVIFFKVKQQQKQMAGQRISRQEKRLVMTLFIVTVASIATWIPLALVWLLKAWNVIFVPRWFYEAVLFLAFSNSLINPIIYVFRMKDFRKALLHLIVTCSRDRPRPSQVVPQPNQQQTVSL